MRMVARHRFATVEVPLAETLPFVRTLVEALHQGAQTNHALVLATSFSERHVRYRLQAAHALRLITTRQQITRRGRRLLTTERGSEDERAAWREAVRSAPIVRAVAPHLLRGSDIDTSAIMKKIMTLTGLSFATANRRARVLLSWSRQLARKPR